MTWVRLEDDLPDHPKIRTLGNTAFRLHIYAICYCTRHLTDGHISRTAVRDLYQAIRDAEASDSESPERSQSGPRASPDRPGNTTRTLVKKGLWVSDGDGYQIHDFLIYQPSKQDVERQRAAARERMQRIRSGAVRENGSGEHPAGSRERSRTPSRPVSKDSSTSRETVRARPHTCPLCSLECRDQRELRDHLDNVHWLQGDELKRTLNSGQPA